MSSGQAIPFESRRRSALRSYAAGLALLWVAGCFAEPEASGDSDNQDAGSATSTSTSTSPATSTATSADTSTQTTQPDETTTSADPDSSGGTFDSGSSTDASSGSGSSTGSTGGGQFWLCAEQSFDVVACESFEPDDTVGLPWTEGTPDQVTVSQEIDPTSGTHRHYVLDGEDGTQARTMVPLDVTEPAIHLEFMTRFQTSVETCSTGTGGDLTMLSLVRYPPEGPAEQLILQVGPSHATLYITGVSTTNVITMEPTVPLDTWAQVTLDLDLTTGTALLDVGSTEESGVLGGWASDASEETLEVSYGPASDNDGDIFQNCEFDIDNVLLAYG